MLRGRSLLPDAASSGPRVVWVFIGGGIGAGKSTLCRALEARMSTEHIARVFFLREYVETSEGLAMLQRFLTHAITPYEFQAYILETYSKAAATIRALAAHDPALPLVVLVERHPMDSVTVFATHALEMGAISPSEHRALCEQCRRIPVIPQTTPSPTNSIVYYLDAATDYASIEADALDAIVGLLGGRPRDAVLYITLLFTAAPTSRAVQRAHLAARAREGEDSYRAEYLDWINRRYTSVYAPHSTAVQEGRLPALLELERDAATGQ